VALIKQQINWEKVLKEATGKLEQVWTANSSKI